MANETVKHERNHILNAYYEELSLSLIKDITPSLSMKEMEETLNEVLTSPTSGKNIKTIEDLNNASKNKIAETCSSLAINKEFIIKQLMAYNKISLSYKTNIKSIINCAQRALERKLYSALSKEISNDAIEYLCKNKAQINLSIYENLDAFYRKHYVKSQIVWEVINALGLFITISIQKEAEKDK